MKEFQIEQNYGDGCKGFLYIEVDPKKEDVVKKAIQCVRDDWKEVSSLQLALHNPSPCLPTIYIKEYEGRGVVKGGIKIKAKWR